MPITQWWSVIAWKRFAFVCFCGSLYAESLKWKTRSSIVLISFLRYFISLCMLSLHFATPSLRNAGIKYCLEIKNYRGRDISKSMVGTVPSTGAPLNFKFQNHFWIVVFLICYSQLSFYALKILKHSSHITSRVDCSELVWDFP